jgi:hypothetical protein
MTNTSTDGGLLPGNHSVSLFAIIERRLPNTSMRRAKESMKFEVELSKALLGTIEVEVDSEDDIEAAVDAHLAENVNDVDEGVDVTEDEAWSVTGWNKL